MRSGEKFYVRQRETSIKGDYDMVFGGGEEVRGRGQNCVKKPIKGNQIRARNTAVKQEGLYYRVERGQDGGGECGTRRD